MLGLEFPSISPPESPEDEVPSFVVVFDLLIIRMVVAAFKEE
jgi:hypothetical protein